MFTTDSTLRPSKMGPQAPAGSNLKSPSATRTARVQVQTNKFFPLEIPELAKSKKSQPSTSSRRKKEEDEDDLPFLVGEKVRAKAKNGVGATGATGAGNGPPSTPLPKALTVVVCDEADDEEDVKSKPSDPPHSFITKYLFTADEEAKRKRKRKKRLKSKESPPTTQQQRSTISPNGLPTSSIYAPLKPSVQPPSTIHLPAFSGSSVSLVQPTPSIAQSARAYIASKGLDAEPKGKTKTRADPSNTTTTSAQPPKEEEKKKKRFFSHFMCKNKSKNKEEGNKENGEDGERVDEEKEKGGFRIGVKPMLRLPPKAASLIGRVLGGKADEKKGQTGMKWEHFVKVCVVCLVRFSLLAYEAEAKANDEFLKLHRR